MERHFYTLTIALLLCGAGYAPTGVVLADESPSNLQLVAYGTLERFADGNGVKYALLDEKGDAVYEVSPLGRVKFSNYLGEKVRVAGFLRSSSDGQLREIRVRELGPTSKVAPAHFLQIADETALSNRSQDHNAASENPPLEPIPQSEPPPEFPDFPDVPPLINEPMLNDEGINVQDGEIFGPGEVFEEGSGVTLQSPTGILPTDDFDAYQDPEQETGSCGPKHWVWGNVEYLFWNAKGSYVPALVTTSPPGTLREDAGVLGVPGTQVLFGDSDLFDDSRNGARWTIGSWFGQKRRFGWQFDYLGLDDEQIGYSNASNGLDILARPFTNVDPLLGPAQGPDSELISYLNVTAGGVTVDATNQFYSLGVDLRANILCKNGCFYDPQRPYNGEGSGYRLDLLGGYRYQHLEDSIAIRTLTSVSVTPQGGFEVTDQFDSQNSFSGGELGLFYQYYRNRWSVDGVLKFALGRTEQKVSINGATNLTTVGIETPFEGGLLALPTNIGTYSRKKTDIIPEFGITGGYLLTRNLRVTCSYRVIYWPKTVRAADSIDLTINGSYIPDPTITPVGSPIPKFTFVDTSYWAQGLSFGVDYRW